MTAPWTPTGDKWPQMAMVMVYEQIGSAVALIGPSAWRVALECLHPMPSTITPEQQAVLDAAVEQRRLSRDLDTSSAAYWTACSRTNDAVRAMHAAQQPPDPVAELKAAWHELLQNRSFQHDAVGRMTDAVAALEVKS